jgi:hypothetical protein
MGSAAANPFGFATKAAIGGSKNGRRRCVFLEDVVFFEAGGRTLMLVKRERASVFKREGRNGPKCLLRII